MQSDRNFPKEDLDIVFISYRESNADENWQNLKSRFPRAKRVHGVKGIREAHTQAAKQSETEFFFVVDGDNQVLPDFHFQSPKQPLDPEALYVYRCKNPVNGLVYGYGAIKIYNKNLINKANDPEFEYTDMATKVAAKYQIIDEVASETHFYKTPEEAWRGAFRECAKLASKTMDKKFNQETEERLKTWTNVDYKNPNAEWVLRGALAGRGFGKSSKANLQKLNDFEWLKQRFSESSKIDSSKKGQEYKKVSQILLGIEQIYPEALIVPRVRYALETFTFDSRNFAKTGEDFLSVVQGLQTIFSQTLLREIILAKSQEEKMSASLRLSSFLMTRKLNFEENTKTLDESFVYGQLRELFDEEDPFTRIKKTIALQESFGPNKDLQSLEKACEHFITLHSSLQFLDFLYKQTNIDLFKQVSTTLKIHKKPLLEEAFSKGQIQSKLWAVKKLKEVAENKFSSPLILCGWYAVMATILFNEFSQEIKKIRSVDVDPDCELIADQLNHKELLDDWRFKASTADIFDIDYTDVCLRLTNKKGESHVESLSFDLIINTSCEHIKDFKLWYNKIPKGQLLLLQSNDFFEIDEHVNCVRDVDEFRSMAPMSEVLFAGSLPLSKYNRFMLIGYK